MSESHNQGHKHRRYFSCPDLELHFLRLIYAARYNFYSTPPLPPPPPLRVRACMFFAAYKRTQERGSEVSAASDDDKPKRCEKASPAALEQG